MAAISEHDVFWITEASRPGSEPWAGQWYVAGARLVGCITSPDGHRMTQSLPFGLPSMQSALMQGRVDPEGEAMRMRLRITEMLNNDLEDRAARLAKAA